MPDSLTPEVFDPTCDAAKVTTFECGSEAWETPLADWIREKASESIEKYGNEVWLYFTKNGHLVGYGALGTTTWHKPKGYFSPSEEISFIPALAIASKYQHKPRGANRQERYSGQIMTHLLTVANDHDSRFVALRVHESNAAAKKLYEYFGFVVIGEAEVITFNDGSTGRYYKMLYRKA